MMLLTQRLAVAIGLFVAHVHAQGQQGSGVEADGAGEITGVPAPGSTVDDPQIDLSLFRPTCVIDDDCDSGNCENGNNDINVQDIEGIFYCGAPQGDEDCQTVADNADPDSDILSERFEWARVDGICNNLNEGRELYGSNQELQLRRMNGVPLNVDEEESGAPESITPRVISDEICDEPNVIPNHFGTSTLLAYCGQFIDHDITLIEFQPAETRISIEGSPPTNTTIVFELSVVVNGSYPVLNPNSATSYMDLSMVYGSDAETAYNLRRPFNMAQLDFSVSELGSREGEFMFLPLAEELDADDRFVATAMSPSVANLYAAGDIRINEQVMLTSWHTLFLREHNRLVTQDLADFLPEIICEPQSEDEQEDRIISDECEYLYQLARRVNIAQWQRIVFGEYWSSWHDDNQDQDGEFALLANYENLGGYDDTLTPAMDIFFSTAAYRFGHTIVNTYVPEKGPMQEDAVNSLFLGNAFFNPSQILARNGISGLLNGAANQCGAARDHQVSSGIRDFLFGNIPGSEFENSDLIAFNIERGRDHEIALYNDARIFYNLEPLETFEEVVTTNAPAGFVTPECVIDDLNDVFGEDEVDNMDPFVGMLLEPASFGQIGETMYFVFLDSFGRMMLSDRFFYLNADGPAPDQLAAAGFSVQNIDETTLSTILNRNTFSAAELSDSETGETSTDRATTFSLSPFIAPNSGEGECCVNDGDTALTPVCFRNTTNERSFYREDVTRCEAYAALIAQDQSFGQGEGSGFVAGTMNPLTFTSYSCSCNVYTDEEQTASIVIVIQDRQDLLDQAELLLQLLADIEAITGESADDRMPEENMDIAIAGDTISIRATCNPTDDPETYMDCEAMMGAIEYAVATDMLASDPNAIMTSEFMVFECQTCDPLPSEFTGLTPDEAAAAGEEATLLGFSVAVGGAIIGGIVVAALIVVGCGMRMYMKKNSAQTFTSGQESV